MNISPLTLEGTHVRLEPLALKHEDDLLAAAQSDEIWEFLPYDPPRKTRQVLHDWMNEAIAETSTGETIWFAIISRADNRAVGVTSYMDIRPGHRGLEIGGTWLTPSVWRMPINTECKYLLLRHAFETLGFIRVQLKTDSRNLRSQKAIARLGAVKEGVLRKQMILGNGYQRDTVMFSILDTEWESVKARLEGILSKK